MGLSAALLWAGGCADDVFRCETASQCQQNGASGTCEANGFCSFPDDDCPSGKRYGAESPDGLANVCVEPEDVAGTEGVTTECGTGTCPDGPDGESSTTTPTSATEPTVGGSDTTTTGDTTGVPPTSGSTEETGSGSSGVPDNCPTIVDEFDDSMVDDLLWTLVDQPSVSEAAGTVRFQVDPLDGGLSGLEVPNLAFVDARIRVDVVELSPLAEFPFRVVLEGAPGTVEVSINGTDSVSVVLDGETVASVAVESPAAGVSLEIVKTLGSVFVSAGPAGSGNLDLLPLGKLGLGYGASIVQLSLLAGNDLATLDAPPFSVQIDRFSYCDIDP